MIDSAYIPVTTYGYLSTARNNPLVKSRVSSEQCEATIQNKTKQNTKSSHLNMDQNF